MSSPLALDQSTQENKLKPLTTANAVPVSVLATAKGSGILAIGKGIETVGRFVVAFLLARMLGADQFGQYTLALATSSLVASFSQLGMDSALVRYIAILADKRDEAGVWGILQVAVGIGLVASVLLGLGLSFFAQTIALAVYKEPLLIPLLQLGGLMVPMAVLNEMLIGASRGFKKMHFPVLAQDVAHLVVRLVLIGILSVVGMSAFWAVATYGIADLISALILGFLLNGVFRWKRPLRTARYELGAVLRFSVPLFLSEMLKKFRSDIQTILLGALYTVSSVGVFTVASKINVVSRISSYSLMTSAEPAFAELHERGDRMQMGDLYRATSRWMFVENFPVVLVMVLFAKPLLSIFGESFESGASALILLSLASLINISTGLGGTIIDMTGYTKLKLINSIAQLSLFVITSVLFIPPWGVIGAASAAMISSSIIQAARMLQVAYLFKLQPYDRWFAKTTAVAFVTAALGLLMRRYLAADTNLLYTALQMGIVFAFYALLIFLFGLAPEDRTIVVRAYARMRTLLFGRKSSLTKLFRQTVER